jgi:hypothetical protein
MSDLIRLVDGVSCPTPSTFSYTLSDNSAEDAGRVQDGNDTMYKNRTSQKRKISLSWLGPSLSTASSLLTMFNPEYVHITYWDMKDNEEQTRQFYVGDRTVPVNIWTVDNKRYTSVSFDIIER